MNDPYKVLGVRQGASAEEVKKAYHQLVKKYHPDRFQDPAAKEMANEKLKDINQAYDMLTNGGARADNGPAAHTNYTGSGSQDFYQVRVHLNNRSVDEAERILDAMNQRTAEWYFLRGVCYSMRGWYAMAREHLQNAVNMEPNNMEYRNALNQIDASTRGYQQRTAAPFGGGRAAGMGGMSTCDMCSCLLCSDCCCEMSGGDLIGCC
jgi:molecular chaperone DnaJ